MDISTTATTDTVPALSPPNVHYYTMGAKPSQTYTVTPHEPTPR